MKKMNWVMGVLLAVCSTAVQAELINTWTGDVGYYGTYFNGGIKPPFDQSFTVPAGKIGTQFEFYVEKGSTTQDYVNVAIWDPAGNLVASNGTPRSDALWGGGTLAWVPASSTALTLAPGTYYATVWSNEPDANQDIYLFRSTTSTYADGYAFLGWGPLPATPLGDNNDFMARLTVVPEPGIFLMLLGGGLSILCRRK